MTYNGTFINDLQLLTTQVMEQSEKETPPKGRAACDLHWENNSAFRSYIIGLAHELLEMSDLKVPADDPQFCEKVNIQRGLIKAANFLLLRAEELRAESYEDYGS